MKVKLIKCSVAVLAAALAAIPTSVGAENVLSVDAKRIVSRSVQLTDAELDAITAGSALSLVVVFNRAGKTGAVGNEDHHLTRFVPTEGKTFTFHRVMNPAHPVAELRCHGHCPAGF
jgi:hypothetical protein